MAENYGLNSRFGFNILPKNRNQANVDLTQDSLNIFNSSDDFEQRYERALNGDLEREINMYMRQAMFVGMNLRSMEPKRTFDMNI